MVNEAFGINVFYVVHYNSKPNGFMLDNKRYKQFRYYVYNMPTPSDLFPRKASGYGFLY